MFFPFDSLLVDGVVWSFKRARSLSLSNLRFVFLQIFISFTDSGLIYIIIARLTHSSICYDAFLRYHLVCCPCYGIACGCSSPTMDAAWGSRFTRPVSYAKHSSKPRLFVRPAFTLFTNIYLDVETNKLSQKASQRPQSYGYID